MLMAPFNCMQVLLRSLPAPPVQRRLYFNTIVACRRRLAKRWEQTPVAKLFTLDDEWSMLLQRAQAVRVGDEAIGRSERHCARMHAYAHHGALTSSSPQVRVREAILQRGLQLHDAFLMFDYDRNGLLSLAEVYGALEWLQVSAARWALMTSDCHATRRA
jgi:hypothetical protein